MTEQIRYAVYGIGGLMIMVVVLAVIAGPINPLLSSEFLSVELATIIASQVNTLSALEGKSGMVEIERGSTYDVHVLFGSTGYVVTVSQEGQEPALATLHAYPTKKDPSLESELLAIKKVCIVKNANEQLAKVKVC